MAGLQDIIANHKRRFADGGQVLPPAILAAHAALIAQKNQQAAQVAGGALSTTPQPQAAMVGTDAVQPPDGATPANQEVNETGAGPRLLAAGGHDLMGGLDNAMAATAAALGGDALAGKMHAAAGEHAARAAALTTDQPQSFHNDVHDIGDAAKFGFGQMIRGAPMLAAMGGAGMIAKGAGLPALAGVAAPSMALNTGSAYSQAADAQGPDATPDQKRSAGVHALAAGAVSAGLDTLAFGYAAKLAPAAKQALSAAVSGSLVGHVTKSLAVEGLSGAARQYVNDVAVKHLLGNPDMYGLTPDDIHGLTDAAAQNVAATAPLGVAGHFGAKIGSGIDKTIDAAGNLVRKVLPGQEPAPTEPGAPAAPEPSIATRAGQAVGGAIDDPQKVVDAAKAAGGAAIEAAKNIPGVPQAGQAASDFAGGLGTSTRVGSLMDKIQTQVGAVREAARGLIEKLKTPDEPGVQKSLATPMTADQRTLRDSLKQDNPKLTINDSIALAKIFEPLASDGKAFDAALAKPGIADHIASLTGKTPDEFKQSVFETLRKAPDDGKEPADRMNEKLQFTDVKNEGKNDTGLEGMSAEDGEHLANLDHSDVLNGIHEASSPDETGQRHPGMTPKMFGSMLSTKQQANAGSKAGGNAWVNVTRTTKDAATGEVKGTTTEPKQVNFVNVSKRWAPQRELSEKAAMFGERSQQKFDNNFKDGLSAMMNGWHETDEHGNPVDVTVQPASQHTEGGKVTAVDKVDMGGWLRPDSVVGTAGGKRTMADVENSGKSTAPVDLPAAIDRYHQTVEADPTKARAAAEPVVRMAVEKIKAGLDGLEPARQAEVVKASIDYASDPTQRPIPADVPSMLRMLPDEVLQHGKARLIAELSDHDMNVVQPKLRGEQATSVDADMGTHPETTPETGRATEDASGQHIDYAKPGETEKSAPIASKNEALTNLNRIRAQATTETGKALLEKAMNVVAKAPMAASEYAKLANPELKPSDIKGILGVERTRAPAGKSGAEDEPAKKA